MMKKHQLQSGSLAAAAETIAAAAADPDEQHESVWMLLPELPSVLRPVHCANFHIMSSFHLSLCRDPPQLPVHQLTTFHTHRDTNDDPHSHLRVTGRHARHKERTSRRHPIIVCRQRLSFALVRCPECCWIADLRPIKIFQLIM